MVDGNCSIDANNLAQGFYDGTDDFLSSFSYAYLDVKYSLGNIFQMTTYIIDDPLAFGKHFLSFSNFPSVFLSTP